MFNKIKNILLIFYCTFGITFACTNCDIPVAEAGPDMTFYKGSIVFLNGIESFDPEGGSLEYTWTAPEGIIIEDILTLDDFAQANDQTVDELEEFISELLGEEVILETLQDLFDAFSDFYQGNDDSFAPVVSMLSAIKKITLPDDISEDTEYIFSLVVNDGDYDSTPDYVTISSFFENTAPEGSVNFSGEVNKNSLFTLDASQISDETLFIADYNIESILTDNDYSPFLEWTWTIPEDFIVSQYSESNSIVFLQAPEVAVDTPYTFNLIVSDRSGTNNESIAISMDITVIANIQPYAVPGEDIYVGAGAVFTLDGSTSYDLDGTIQNYLWTFPDGIDENNDIVSGSTSTAVVEITAPNVTGDYEFLLTVTDNNPTNSNSYNSTNLFISEYNDASSSGDRYIEIYNGTENSVDLSEYSIKIYKNNSSGTVYELQLDNTGGGSYNSGSLSSGQTLLIVKSDSGNDLLDLLDENGNGNDNYDDTQFIEFSNMSNMGDDAVELLHNDSRIDVVGTPENYLSGEWNIGGSDATTKDIVLVRKNNITDGVLLWTSSSNETCQYDDENSYGCIQWDVYEQNTYLYGANHYCSLCDNSITVTVSDNLVPIADISGYDDDTGNYAVFVGSEISLDGSMSADPEGESLTFNWTSDYTGLQIIGADTSTPSFIVPDDSDGLLITFTLEVSDGALTHTDTIILSIETENEAPTISVEVEKMNDNDGDETLYNGEIFEGYEIFLNAVNSDDSQSSTGIMTFLWSAPEVDYNNDGVNDIIFSNSVSSNPTFTVGDYYGIDRTYDITLEVSDGDLSSVEIITLNLTARMPIIGVENLSLTGYEGQYIRMEALTTEDPNGSISNLEFDWSGSNSQTFGVCVSGNEIIDNNGNIIGTEDYDDSDWCNSTSDCNGNGTCSRAEAVAFRLLPTSIGQNTEYSIDVETEDDDGYDSEKKTLTITSVARYPVANSGYDRTYVMGEKFYLFGQMSHDPQEKIVTYSYYDDDNQWETGENVGLISFYNDIYVCKDDMLTSCNDDNDCPDSDCITKVTPKNGYTFTWSDGGGTIPENIYNQLKNEVNPCLTCIAPYDQYPEMYPAGIFDECGVDFFSGEYDPDLYTWEFELEIIDDTQCSVNCENSSGPDDTEISLVSSNSSEVTITLSQNCKPTADAGKNIVFNRGEPQEIEVYTSDFRAHTGAEFTLDGSRSIDTTPIEELSYLWTVRGYCPEGHSQLDFTECTAAQIELSDETSVVPAFTVPTDLCVDGISIDEKSCCENNSGIWQNDGTCSDNQLWEKNGKKITITLEVSDGFLTSVEDTITVTYNAYSIPSQPVLYATGTHYEGDEEGSINLFWDNEAEDAIDDLTHYADFQGYRVYRSEDYGQTWGSPSIIQDGEILGWEPYEQFDMSAEQDSTYCLFKNDNKDCGYDSDGNQISTTELNRYNQISGVVSWVDGFAWQNLGTNKGLAQTLIDTDIIDGVDYTYTVTSYDRGVRPDTLIYGHYGKLESNGTWNDNIWVQGSPLYTFQDTMVTDTFSLYQLDYRVLKSLIIGPDTDLSFDGGGSDNVKVNNIDILEDTHFLIIDYPEEWNVGGLDNENVSMDDIDSGVTMGWETNRGAPMTNPYGYPPKQSLESALGQSDNNQNFVTISADYYATNITFPTEEQIDEFIAADCKAIGNGGKFYEIVNEDGLESSLVRFEIQADDGVDIFEGYKLENPCLYAYRAEEIIYNNAPTEYIPLELDGENITHSLSGCSEIDCSDCYYESEDDLELLLDLPGVSINCEEEQITIPNYLVECHELDYIDDPNYQGNWTPFFNGIRMRFDNALRNEPDNFEAALDSLSSFIESCDDNGGNCETQETILAWGLSREDERYGYVKLLFENNFNNRPAYEYEIEFSTSFIDTAFENTTDQFDGSLARCGRSFSTLLPFKVKNLTTGKYVKIKHTDDGIWNGISTNVPGWFDDTQEHPGAGDCFWSPGEFLTFERDSVILGNTDDYSPEKTFKLEMSYNYESILAANDICTYILPDYDQSYIYPAGICIYTEGVIWYASTLISPQDGFLPNQWYDDNDSSTELNANPWTAVYPWQDGEKMIISPKKWYVDGDYWIADMSLLGETEEINENDLDEITVVPNPYIVSSKYNESANLKQINFMHLPDECTISIYTITGELVDIINHGPGSIKSSITWDLKNQFGRHVAPGLYIYKVETQNGLSRINKFAIVR